MNKYPASSIQEQFWLLNKLQPDNPAYNIPSLFYINGHLQVEKLKMSLYEIIRRHDIFRTVFERKGNQLYQIIQPETQLAFNTVNLKNLTQKEENQIITREIITPFDLEKGPLFRVTLVCLDSQKYILLFMMHHIITDLRSKEIFASELSELYRTFALDTFSPLSTPTQYKEFSAWQLKFIENEKCKAMLDYWHKTFKNHTGYLNLPTDNLRPPVQKISGESVDFELSKASTNTLKKFCHKKNTDIFLTLLTAYFILLFRYTDQKDIVTGVPLTNRRQDSHKNTAGCFINILPIAVQASGGHSFLQLLQQVRRVMLGAHRNQETPYNLIFKSLLTKRDQSFNPLFQTGFTFEPPMELDLLGVEVISKKIHNSGSQLDLFLNLWEKNQKIYGLIEFNKELFKHASIDRFMGNYKTLIWEIVANPEEPIDSLNILTEEERHRQLVEWNATKVALPDDPVLPRSFEKQAAMNPDSIAFIDENSHLTYRQLNIRANQLAHHLKNNNIGPGSLVGVIMDRSINMAVALYAILKAGGAYVPIDPAFPQDRIAYMLGDTGLKLILTEEKIASLLPENDSKIIFIDTIGQTIENQPTSNPDVKISPENLAYVIYTSGSTGKPKGVQVPHRAAVNFLNSMSNTPGIKAKDTLLSVTTLSFDISVLELFLPQIAGAKTIIASQKAASNGEELLKLIHKHNATIIQATPVTFYLLLAAGWEGSDNFKVLCGGEPVPLEMARELNKRASRVWNMYGPTETTVWSTCCRIEETDNQILVGKPIENTQTYIVNKNNQPNPIGVAGELLIGGTGITHGYLNRPNLTNKVFIQNIFNKNSAEDKLYKTGDMASYLPDGSIKVLGRIDNQIKLRGYRIELGEIESVLEAHSSINRAASIVREDIPGDKRLVVYVTLNNVHEFSEIKLKQYLRTKLPDYMIPTMFIQLSKMPLTLNCKIDRKALPELEQKVPVPDLKFSPPKSKLEKDLFELFTQKLKTEAVGIQDNFFDIGGNSLLSVQLVALIEENLNITIPIAKFYQYPTIESLGEYINSIQNQYNCADKKLNHRLQKRTPMIKKQRKAMQKMKLNRQGK